MERYIGLDVHATSCSLAVVSGTGKRLHFEVVPTSGAAIIDAIKKVRGRVRVCMEEGTLSGWLYEILEPVVEEVVVLALSERKGRMAGNKNDMQDAFGLAEKLRMGGHMKKVYKDTGEFKKLRALVKTYGFITEDVVRTQNRLKAAYRSEGISTSGTDIYDESSKEDWLNKLSVEVQTSVRMLHEAFEALSKLKVSAEKEMISEARAHPAFSLLKSVPGLGPIRAAQIMSVVVAPERFRGKKQFWPYCGFAVVTDSSDDYEPLKTGGFTRKKVTQTRGLNKNHNPLLKNVFKGAAMTVVQMRSGPLYAGYERSIKHKRPNMAMLTLARKIAAVALAVWKSNTPYDSSRLVVEKKELVENQALTT